MYEAVNIGVGGYAVVGIGQRGQMLGAFVGYGQMRFGVGVVTWLTLAVTG